MFFTLQHYQALAPSVVKKYFMDLISLPSEKFYDYEFRDPLTDSQSPPNAVAVMWIWTRYSSMERGWDTADRFCYLDKQGYRIGDSDREVDIRVDLMLERMRKAYTGKLNPEA